MLSSIAAPTATHFSVSCQPFSCLNNPRRFFPIVLVISRQHPLSLKRKQVQQEKQKNQFFFEFSECCGCGVVRMCKKWEWGGEGDPGLELEVLELMKKSRNPDRFPTKRELIEAGRLDLVEAIMKKGGWMSMGWEHHDEVEIIEGIGDVGFARKLGICLEKLGENGCQSEGRSESELIESQHLEVEGISSLGNSSPAASSSGRSLCHPERSKPASLGGDGPMLSDNGLERSYKAETWRTWSIQRAGFSDKEFEAAEIDFSRNTNGRTVDISVDEIIAVTADVKEPLSKANNLSSSDQEASQSDVKTRLQQLELELSSVLHTLRSNTSGLSEKVREPLSEDLRQLSDASEFQENEIMNAQDNLRSIRAKLAVLEGKMALAIINVQKILDEKQKRINSAHSALQLLRTICIVWPNSGSEVLLTGSYDGWASQRKMERSSSGIFSLNLKLYPGKYEIKFIVDGSWKVDPLRTIVNNDGLENNLLIIN